MIRTLSDSASEEVSAITQPGSFQNLNAPQGETVNEQVGKRKDDIQQVGDDWVTVGRLIPQG